MGLTCVRAGEEGESLRTGAQDVHFWLDRLMSGESQERDELFPARYCYQMIRGLFFLFRIISC